MLPFILFLIFDLLHFYFFAMLYNIYSSLVVLILNNLNNSTITSGASISITSSIIFAVGRTGILNIVLKPGIARITIINSADAPTANNNFLLFNIPVLNTDNLLFLTLNTCTSSESASVTNAIVCPTSILDSSNVKPSIASVVVAKPIINAPSVRSPIIIPWYITLNVIPFVNTPFPGLFGFLFIMSLFAGSNANAKAGSESVTKFIHNMCIGSNISK